MVKRLLSDVARNKLYLDCLNGKFDEVLDSVRNAPYEMDYSFLQMYLSRSCHWGHIDSVSHIWYRYVMRSKVLIIKPSLLCDMSNLALNEGKHFLPEQICEHYKQFYSKYTNDGENRLLEYDLLRIKVESFAKGTSQKTNFREKWKVFLEDVDNYFPTEMEFRVRDYPHLTKSMETAPTDTLMSILFNEGKKNIMNNTTLPLLLNMILLQPQHHISFKTALFERFHQAHRSLNYDDTFTILFRLSKGDGYRLNKLMEYARENQMPRLSALSSKMFLEGIRDTNYAFNAREFRKMLTQGISRSSALEGSTA